ncbi:Response regulator c-di-GMP phosphodiesterase, RpfG family, contains REC and HD-GYP domains [Pollutimonas bauzanensis]|uniref:Response regulator c-di-GMP phosphodiesterase, RpfG family, contains REC and HD-GYP domains n=2 Tax=Pollutimonas bauzanensis TaxID=658167 RepID=A0A1M5LR57_9BURK|nr:Response regulator c-di-GMP phosphodiesterase, RpfG family, contains REC and HD-GYP domains [Pollutimonas bauzanensis]
MVESQAMEASTTLLLVDDEKNITSSLQRVLRRQPYRILTAESGEAALEILEGQDVDLVISDGRMPGMDGATLLAQVQHRWPERLRIMLTGYSDIDSTIKAINDGKIHRYISKPWDDDELCVVIEQMLQRQQQERELARRHRLAHEQNSALQDANAALQARVRERTAELEATADLLAVAHANQQRSYLTATQVFSSLIGQRLPQNRQTNKEVGAVVRAFCKAREFPQKLADDLSMAAALYNIGKLTWDDALIALPVEKMEKDQRERYRDYPGAGESLLMALEPAQDVALFIRHHQERWDGGGFPDGLAGHAIPLGARVLKMAVDFVEMQKGMVLARRLSCDDVLGNMPKYSARLYDPLLCQEFIGVAARIENEEAAAAGDHAVLELNILSLEPGMIIARDLHAASGMLLLKENTILTERFIEKLRAFEENEGTKYTFYVRCAQPEASQE